jgi:hypothetical protein
MSTRRHGSVGPRLTLGQALHAHHVVDSLRLDPRCWESVRHDTQPRPERMVSSPDAVRATTVGSGSWNCGCGPTPARTSAFVRKGPACQISESRAQIDAGVSPRGGRLRRAGLAQDWPAMGFLEHSGP